MISMNSGRYTTAMLSRKCWLQVICGGGGCLFTKSLVNLSTPTQTGLTQNVNLVDYLINSLGFSIEAAIATSSKVTRSRPFQKKADSVVSYLENLGLKKTHIRTMVSGYPGLLFCKVDKTLEPKFKFFQELGLSGSDLIKVIMGYRLFWRFGLDSHIKSRILYLRQLMGTDEKVAAVLKKYSRVIGCLDTKTVESNLTLLRNFGISDKDIVRLIIRRPRRIFATKPEQIEEILHRVENVLGIPRESAMFQYGVDVLFSFRGSNIDAKFGVLRSFGWSDLEILRMVRILPLTLCMSGPRIRKVLDYFMNELGYDPDYLASHPVFLSLSFEKRVKPRSEVFKILNEKKLNKRKAVLYSVLVMTESKFAKDYILPYKDILPEMYEAYISKVEIPKRE